VNATPATDTETSDVQWLTIAQLSEQTGIKPSTIRSWICRGIGPPYYKLGASMVRFRQSDIDAWVESRRVDPAPPKPKRKPGRPRKAVAIQTDIYGRDVPVDRHGRPVT
jgi:excisionase family DNA binding protein